MIHQTILTAILLFGTSVLGAPAAEAASSLMPRRGEYVGGIDMNTACHSQYGDDSYAIQKDNTCNGWGCNDFGDTNLRPLYDVDVNSACTEQHGVSAYGFCNTGAWGWGCYKN
jgi:hypothetical protein